MQDVLARERLGNLEALRVDLVKRDHLGLGLKVHPGRLFQVKAFQAMGLLYHAVLVGHLTLTCIHNNSAVVGWYEVRIAVFL